nr:MAG TPA: hypothetical protein [Caudoviricetes sp.]
MALINSRPQRGIVVCCRTNRGRNIHPVRPINQHSTNELFFHNRHETVEHFLILSINIHVKRMLINILGVPNHRHVVVQIAINLSPTVIHNIKRHTNITSKGVENFDAFD